MHKPVQARLRRFAVFLAAAIRRGGFSLIAPDCFPVA
jgi:hypothetical protein